MKGGSIMSKIRSFFLFFLLIYIPACSATAAQITLAWEPSPSTPDGYRIYYGTTSGQHPNIIEVGNETTYTVTGLQDSTRYYFVVTAYLGAQESLPSDEVNGGYFPDTPLSPGNLRVLH